MHVPAIRYFICFDAVNEMKDFGVEGVCRQLYKT